MGSDRLMDTCRGPEKIDYKSGHARIWKLEKTRFGNLQVDDSRCSNYCKNNREELQNIVGSHLKIPAVRGFPFEIWMATA